LVETDPVDPADEEEVAEEEVAEEVLDEEDVTLLLLIELK
jgi:hypothetical protein